MGSILSRNYLPRVHVRELDPDPILDVVYCLQLRQRDYILFKSIDSILDRCIT